MKKINCSLVSALMIALTLVFPSCGGDTKTVAGANTVFYWQGNLSSAPANPYRSWAYYNTTSGSAYIYDGSNWQAIGQGSSPIDWRGALSSAPDTPQSSWAYYNTSSGISYIYDGASWQQLPQNANYDLTVSGSVESGSYLELKHNLNRADLTFNGQFIKDDNIYTYDSYTDLFAGSGLLNPQRYFESGSVSYVSAAVSKAASPNNNVMVAYSDNANSDFGTFIIYDPECLYTIKAKTVFSMASTIHIQTAALKNGNFLIVWQDETAGDYKFAVYSSSGSKVTGPTTIAVTNSRGFGVAALNNTGGDFVVVYFYNNSSRHIKYGIYSASGSLIRENYEIYSDCPYVVFPKVAALSGGGFAILDRIGGDPTWSYIKVYDGSGNPANAQTLIDNCETAWTASNGNVAVSLSTDKKAGSSSVQLAVADTLDGNSDAAYFVLPSPVTYPYSGQIGFWIKSSMDINDDEWSLFLSSTTDCATRPFDRGLPRLAANTWTYVVLYNRLAPFTVKGIGIRQRTDKGAMTLLVDDINILPAKIVSSGYGVTMAIEPYSVSMLGLSDGKIALAYRHTNADGFIELYDSTGTNQLTQYQFTEKCDISYPALTQLSGGNVVLAFTDSIHDNGRYALFSSGGELVKKDIIFHPYRYLEYVSLAPMSNDNFITAFRNRTYSNAGSFITDGYHYLSLEKVDDNTVRLWNRTGETLELVLSVQR